MIKRGKNYITRLFRSARLTKPAANELYEFMKEELVYELEKGNTINLFGIVNLVPYKHEGKEFKGFMNTFVADKGYRVKAFINRSIKGYLRDKNSRLGGLVKHIGTNETN